MDYDKADVIITVLEVACVEDDDLRLVVLNGAFHLFVPDRVASDVDCLVAWPLEDNTHHLPLPATAMVLSSPC